MTEEDRLMLRFRLTVQADSMFLVKILGKPQASERHNAIAPSFTTNSTSLHFLNTNVRLLHAHHLLECFQLYHAQMKSGSAATAEKPTQDVQNE